jgi:hypothetical protein
VKRRRGKNTIQPENIQEDIQREKPSQDTQENAQTKQPSLENLTEQFFKIYELDMAQVLDNLGTRVTENTGRYEEHQAPTSSSNPTLDLLDIEMSFPEDTEQLGPHIEVNNPLEQT